MAARELPEFAKILPFKEHLIFKELFRVPGAFVPKDRLVNVLYADDSDGGPLWADRVVTVLVSRLRKRIAATGWVIEGRYIHGYRLVVPSRHLPDISVLTSIIEKVETAVADKQETLSTAAADLARTVGPLAAAHRLAELAMEMSDLAEQEAGREGTS